MTRMTRIAFLAVAALCAVGTAQAQAQPQNGYYARAKIHPRITTAAPVQTSQPVAAKCDDFQRGFVYSGENPPYVVVSETTHARLLSRAKAICETDPAVTACRISGFSGSSPTEGLVYAFKSKSAAIQSTTSNGSTYYFGALCR